MDMPLHVDVWEILLRLMLAAVAGGVFGFNREQSGHAAGFRTTILVTLAAAIAMTQANLLLPAAGKTPDSFSVIDVARFPLGILTGVGFIGGGTILKRGNLVTGVTTAATLWIATAVGLAFGGGQLLLGGIGTVLGVLTLSGLRRVDDMIPRRCKVEVTLRIAAEANSPFVLAVPQGYQACFRERRLGAGATLTTFEVSWMARDAKEGAAELLAALSTGPEVIALRLESESAH
jgi:putative Mg2+ transporter-C (MgtC) family protein